MPNLTIYLPKKLYVWLEVKAGEDGNASQVIQRELLKAKRKEEETECEGLS